jgi:hypothetical protein
VKFSRTLLVLAFSSVLVASPGYAKKKKQPPPPPAPAPVVYSYRPYPPMGAAPNLAIPPRSVTGARLTINSNVSPEQAAWNLRSAFNVAALNCMDVRHAAILENYRSFLNTHKTTLRSVNTTLDQKFKADFGKRSIPARELYQTQVYNYFALPPTIPAFCDAALLVGTEFAAVPKAQLLAASPAVLARMEKVFLDFFDGYDKYKVDFVAWQIDYRTKYGVQPSDAFFMPGELRYQPQPAVQIPGAPPLIVPQPPQAQGTVAGTAG